MPAPGEIGLLPNARRFLETPRVAWVVYVGYWLEALRQEDERERHLRAILPSPFTRLERLLIRRTRLAMEGISHVALQKASANLTAAGHSHGAPCRVPPQLTCNSPSSHPCR